MRRTDAATPTLIILALVGAIAFARPGARADNARRARSASDAATTDVIAQPALTSLRHLDANGFFTRHDLALQDAPSAAHDTVTRVYALRNRLLHTRLRLFLTTVGEDRVIRVELGFAPFLLEGATGPATRALLSDLLGTFVPSADAERVTDLRAEINANTALDADSTVTREATGATRAPTRVSDAYLALRYRRDSVRSRYSQSQVWIDNHYEEWRTVLDTKRPWVDSATVVQIALPGDTLSRTLFADWDQRPEVLGGTLAVLRKCLGREEIEEADAIRTGNTIRYAVRIGEEDFVLLVQLDSDSTVQEVTFQQMNLPERSDSSGATRLPRFIEIAWRIVPDIDQGDVMGDVFNFRNARGPGDSQRVETAAFTRMRGALTGKRGPAVMNFTASSLRFDLLNGALPRMTMRSRGGFGPATDAGND